MPTIPVACLVLIDPNGFLLATQRPNNKSLPGLWEFPGGKIEPNESPESALRRELIEELHLHVDSLLPLNPITHQYDFATIHLIPFLSHCISRPDIHLVEHTAARWIHHSNANTLDWAPADLPILHAIQSSHNTRIPQ